MNLVSSIRGRLALLKRRLRVVEAYYYDLKRFAANSLAWHTRRDQMHIKGQLLRKLHSLEKGLSLPPPRRVFGEAKMSEIETLVEMLRNSPGDEWVLEYAREVMAEVKGFNQKDPASKDSYPVGGEGDGVAVISLDREQVLRSLPASPETFFQTRRSVRIFDDRPVSEVLLRRATELAQLAPSVCNRQSGRVRFFSEESSKAAILELQDGNKGFGHRIPTVGIVTSDLHCFHGGHERNQGYVDGGLFAMSLTFALHTLGLGSCMMNWCVAPETDLRLRTLVKIPESEIIITLMAVGNLPESYHVARSRRRPLSEVLLELR